MKRRESKGVAPVVIAVIIVIIVVAAGVAYYVTRPKPLIGTVAVYGGIHEFEIMRLCDKFTEDTGIPTEWIRMSAGELAARVEAEKDSPKGDVLLGGDKLYHSKLAKKGLIEPYVSPTAAEIDAKYKDPEGYWTGFYVGAIGFGVNKDIAKKLGMENKHPKKWDDLLDPVWKGEVSVAKAYTSGTAYTTVSTILMMRGEVAGWDYLLKLHKNIKTYPKSGAAPARSAAAGEFAIGISFGHDIIKPLVAGYPLKLIYPEDGTGWEIGAVSIIKGGPNTEGAKRFVDWMLTKGAQQLHSDLSFRISTHPGVIMPPGVPSLAEIKLIPYDWEWAEAHYDRICDKWKTDIEAAPK